MVEALDPASREEEADRAASRGEVAAARRILEEVTAAAPERSEAWLKLAAMCRSQRDGDGALAAISGALRVDPLGFLPLLMKASLLDSAGRVEEAGEAYGHALAQRPEAIPPELAAAVANAERRHAEHIEAASGRLARATEPLETELKEVELGRVRRFHSNIVRSTGVFHSEPSHFHYPGLRERELPDRGDF